MPVRILLIGAVVFLAAWFTILRPKPAAVTTPPLTQTTTTTAPAATSTPQTALGRAVAKAKAVAGATSTPAAGAATTQTETATKAATPTPAPVATVPAEELAKLPTDVAGALSAHKVLVLAVLSDEVSKIRPLADDDRSVRNSLAKVNRYGGDVFVKQVGINQLSTYGPLVNDLHVTQSPSVVVIDSGLKATVLAGSVARVSINQAVADARRSSMKPNISDPYLRTSNVTCGHYETRVTRWSSPTIRGQKAELASGKRLVAVVSTYRNKIARTPAPAKYRAFKRQWVRVMSDRVALIKRAVKKDKAGTLSESNFWDGFDNDAAIKLDRKFD